MQFTNSVALTQIVTFFRGDMTRQFPALQFTGAAMLSISLRSVIQL